MTAAGGSSGLSKLRGLQRLRHKLSAGDMSGGNLHDRLSQCESALVRLQTQLVPPVGTGGLADMAPNEASHASSLAPRYIRNTVGPAPVRFDTKLERYGSKTFSQQDEDGIVAYLVSTLGISRGFFVEFGVGPNDHGDLERDGMECNCRLLQDQGWTGLMMDGRSYPDRFGIKQERITALNIETLLAKYNVPLEFDLLSIDVDGQDFWIWMAIQRFPRLVIVEYNPSFHADESFVIPMDARFVWDGTQWYGASLLALHTLAVAKGYVLLYANGVNAFFVRQDLIANPQDFLFEDVFNYRGKLVYHVADRLNRPYQRV